MNKRIIFNGFKILEVNSNKEILIMKEFGKDIKIVIDDFQIKNAQNVHQIAHTPFLVACHVWKECECCRCRKRRGEKIDKIIELYEENQKENYE